MSVKTSVHNYNKAYKLFQEVDSFWRRTQTGELSPTDYQYMNILDKVEDLQKAIDRVNLREIEEYLTNSGKLSKFDEIKQNLKTMKEGAYYLSRVFLGWSYWGDLLDSVPRFIALMQKKDPLKVEGNKSDIARRFVSTITHPDKVERYKNNIEAIIRGNMTIPYFTRIYDALMAGSKPPKKSTEDVKRVYPNPPEMYTGKSKEEWEENLRKREADLKKMRKEKRAAKDVDKEKPKEIRKGAKDYIKLPSGEEMEYNFKIKDPGGLVKYFLDKKEIYSYLSESFISLEKYKKVFKL